MKKNNKLSTRNIISSIYPEEYTEKWNVCSKKKMKKKGDKQMEQNYEDSTKDKAIMNVDKFYGDTLFENYHDLNKNKTRNSNSNKDELTGRIPIASALGGDTLVKKKKKKKKGDKQMEQNYEDSTKDKAIMNVDKFYGDTLFENYHDLNKNKTRNSNSNKDELTGRIPIASALGGDTLVKKKKKKKKGDKQMEQNYEDSTKDKAIMNVDKFYGDTLFENYHDLNKNKTRNSNSNKDELTGRIPIASALGGDTLVKKKKKKKKGDKQMEQNYEDSTKDKAIMNVDKFYGDTLFENYHDLNKNKTRNSNSNKDELTGRIPIASALGGDTLVKKKKKKKKEDKQMEQNYEDSTKDKAIMNVDKFYGDTLLENYHHLNKNKTRNSNSNKDELTGRIPIASALGGDTLVKKKKKKKKGDKQMEQNYEDSTKDKAIMNVDKFYGDTLLENYHHLNKNKTRNSNSNKDELTGRIPIASALGGDTLVKKKKKKKKEDKQMEQNYEDSTKDKAIMNVDKFYGDTLFENYHDLNKDETRDSNSNKDELTGRIPIASASEGDTLVKKKKKKKKGDKQMEQNYEDSTKDKAIMNVDKFYGDTLFENYHDLNKNKTRNSNSNKDELTGRIPIASALGGDTLVKKKKKKKKGDKQMEQNYEDSTKDKAIMNVDKFYGDTLLEHYHHLNKNKTRNSNSNKDELTGRIPIASALGGDTLVKKKKKKKKEDKHMEQNYEDSTKDKAIMNVDKFYGDIYKHLDKDETRNSNLNNDSSALSDIEYVNVLLQTPLNKKTKSKVVNSKMSNKPKKSNKRKRKSYDEEYSKNDTPQSVNTDVETLVSNNYIIEDGGKKLEFFDSLDDDQTSEYRTMTDTGMYFGQYQTFNNDNDVHSQENVITGQTPLQCDVCFKTFTYLSNLAVHKRTHTGEKPYACNVCGQSFSHKSTLVTHNRTHTGEKPYACEVCGKSFSRQYNLITHNRTHTGEKPYACNICGRLFSQQANLVAHNRIHTGEKPYPCNVCGQSFSLKSTLVKHNRTHTGEKPYPCNVCGQSFSQKSTLVTHNRTHTGERPFECGQCEKKFSSSSHCKRHTLRVHTKCL